MPTPLTRTVQGWDLNRDFRCPKEIDIHIKGQDGHITKDQVTLDVGDDEKGYWHNGGWMIEVNHFQSVLTNQQYMLHVGDTSSWTKAEEGEVIRYGWTVRPETARYMDWIEEHGTSQKNRPLRRY